MSAYVVSTDTIDLLVTAAYHWRLSYGPVDPGTIGDVLLAENVRSVNYRYRLDDPIPAYKYHAVDGPIDPVVVLKSIQCLGYQSCETDDWETTIAWKVLKALEGEAISRLPGYEAAPWGWERIRRVPR